MRKAANPRGIMKPMFECLEKPFEERKRMNEIVRSNITDRAVGMVAAAQYLIRKGVKIDPKFMQVPLPIDPAFEKRENRDERTR